MDTERIPHPLTTLIGRTDLLAEVGSLLRDPAVRLVTLTGAGGSGKTRLALELADRAASDPSSTGPFILVSLADVATPDRVPLAILRRLGRSEDPGRSALSTIRDEIAERAAVLVLDNFEHVIDAAPHIATLLAGTPNLTILVTSRVRLRLRGEREVVVPPLTLSNRTRRASDSPIADSDAVQLFVERARQIRSSFALDTVSRSQVIEICERLDGLPLAIELAAARLNVLSVTQLRERLSGRLDLLGDGPRDLPARQQTMRAAIAWSIDLLSDQERQVLATLAVFVGGFSLTAAEAVGPADQDVFPVIASLVEKSLVRRIDRDEDVAEMSPRFALLETIRTFALELLHATSTEPDVRRRHAGFVLGIAKAAETGLVDRDHVAWLDRLETEADNIRAALRWTIDHQESDLARRIGGSLWLWWCLRGALHEGRSWLGLILALPSGSDADADLAKVLTGAGALAELQGDDDSAEGLLDDAISRAVFVGDHRTDAMARLFRGLVAFDRGDLGATRSYAEASLDAFTRLDDSWGTALALAELGMVDLRAGDGNRASERLIRSRDLFRAFGVTWGVAMTTANLGLTALERHDFRRCEALLIEALALFHTVGDRWGTAMYLDSLARAAREDGRLERAATLFGAHAALCEAIGVGVKPLYLGGYHWNIESAREGLGDQRFSHAFAMGHGMSIEQTIAYAAAPRSNDPALTSNAVLSPREIDVLRLITRGQSDRQIAETLFISVRTVSTHASSIFAKLAVGSRTAAATAALTRGLI